ncbi:MAG: hypothetical protein CVU22_07005 [Betaproteobacteria bacterium HGW-Betaproteobacteria-16]|nr:MAG: hypothetical protein CVU22_07005 [Betaproteobacteria bacterium HGW-Betaproteobacteria-16]
MINVNATGCGRGKSTFNRLLITRNSDTRFLVIVPSLVLAEEYSTCGTVIHSENTKNVQQKIFRAIEANTQVIVITQKAFLDCPSKRLLCENRTVIQDEHLEVYYTCNWRMTNHKDWLEIFSLSPSKHDGWNEVFIDTEQALAFMATEDMLDDKQIVEDLLVTPQRIFTNRPGLEWDSMLFRLISPDVYAGADAVHITCANFTATRQFHIWSKLFGTHFHVTHAFERYATPALTVHYAGQRHNSKTFNTKDSSIRAAVINYIEQRCTNPVYVDNNCYDTQRGWQRVDHNCHGVNQYRDQRHVAFLSAINYSNLVSTFLRDVVNMDFDEIRYALVGEMAHQVVMRGALRQDSCAECHVYLMETDLAAYLLAGIFTGAHECLIDGTCRPPKAPPIAGMDRKKACRIRQNFEEFNGMSTHDLMKHPIWQMTNSNGRHLKSHRAASEHNAEA